MALEVVLVVRLPRLRAHVAEILSTGTGHKIAAHRSLDCLLTPGANLGVLGNPLGISFFLQDLLHPHLLFLASAGVVIIALAAEAEDLAARAGHCVQLHVNLDAVGTVHSRAELVVPIGSDEQLADLLLVLLQPNRTLLSISFQQTSNGLQKYWATAFAVHALRERGAFLDASFEMADPAFYTKLVTADIGI